MFYLSSSSSTRATDLRVLFLDRARSALQLTIAFLTLQDDYDAYWDEYIGEESETGHEALIPSPRMRRHPITVRCNRCLHAAGPAPSFRHLSTAWDSMPEKQRAYRTQDKTSLDHYADSRWTSASA
jgi:hypothetical protein